MPKYKLNTNKKPTEASGFMEWRISDSNRPPLACKSTRLNNLEFAKWVSELTVKS